MRFLIISLLCLSFFVIGLLFFVHPGEFGKNQQSPSTLTTDGYEQTHASEDESKETPEQNHTHASNEQARAESQNPAQHYNAMDDMAMLKKHISAFNTLFSTDPEAARVEFAKAVKAQYGEHPFIDEWLEIHFRLTRDKKGTLADFIRLTELRIQLLTDLDAAKYAEQIEVYQISLKQLSAMVKTVDNPETFELRYEPR